MRKSNALCLKEKSGNISGRPTADKLVNPKSISGNELRIQDFKADAKKIKTP